MAATTTICCPACHRALTLPIEAANRLVQCPACRHAFHPAAAEVAGPRPALKPDPMARRDPPPASARDPGRPPSRPPFDDAAPPRRSRRKREDYDVCPKCDARLPRGAERCTECRAEFEPEPDDRPWERSGAERRDSDPHRGGLILTMGIGSLLMWVFFFCPIAGLVGSAVSLMIGIAAFNMGRGDLRKIDQHAMAREGRGMTHGGMVCGIVGIVLSSIGTLIAVYATIAYLQ